MLNPEYHHTGLVTPSGRWLNGRFVDRPGEGGPVEAAAVPDAPALVAGAAGAAPASGACSAPVACGLSPDAPLPIEERRPLVVIPPPGETAWLSEALERRARASMPGLPRKRNVGESASGKGAGKRERDEAMVEAGEAALPEAATDGEKRARAPPEAAAAAAADASAPASGLEGASPAVPCARSYDPLSPPPPGSAMVFIPGCEEGAARLNALVECVGILSLVPELGAAPPPAADDPWATELAASRLPTSQVPRVHALALETVEEAREVEAVARDEAAARSAALPPLAELREVVLRLLTAALAGDELAAELTLLQLVAKEVPAGRGGTAADDAPAVGSRVLWLDLERLIEDAKVESEGVGEGGTDAAGASAGAGAGAEEGANAGGAPTTLAPVPAPASRPDAPGVARLLSTLAALAPRVVRIACDVPSLNGPPLWPRRDPASARLQRSPLQVAAGTLMLLDETRLEAGRLGDSGVKNLAALRDVASRRKAPYEFEVFSMDLPVHASVLIVTKGASGLLGEAAGAKPLAVRPAAAAAARPAATAPSAVELFAARAYLAHCRTLDARIGPACAAGIEADLASARSRDRELSQEDMHDWLNLARLLAVSRGEAELSESRWKEAGELRARIERRGAARTGPASIKA